MLGLHSLDEMCRGWGWRGPGRIRGACREEVSGRGDGGEGGGGVMVDPTADITARAVEVFGTRERALRWLNTPVRALSDQTPISLLSSSEGVARVQDTLGQVEHGVW